MSVFTALKRARSKKLEFLNSTFSESARLCMQTSSDGTPHDYDQAEELDKILPPEIVNLDDPALIRRALSFLVLHLELNWIYLFPSGRDAVRNALSRNEFQVFRNAELFQDTPSIEVVTWWDKIANNFRSPAIDNSFREAELKSLEWEKNYLREAKCPYEPTWVALNDNSLGFDIRSYRYSGNEWVPFPIEVKSTVGRRLRFYLTRNEADLAFRMKKNYALHFWFSAAVEPLVFNFNEISMNFPSENGNGKWESLVVDYGYQSESFKK
jgi:hypothetical protein